MELVFRGTVAPGQDGAVWGDFLFRFDHKGHCHVYDLTGEDIPKVGSFRLDRWETLCPHSNSVSFGADYWTEGDEFPLLYSNIYNNQDMVIKCLSTEEWVKKIWYLYAM